MSGRSRSRLIFFGLEFFCELNGVIHGVSNPSKNFSLEIASMFSFLIDRWSKVQSIFKGPKNARVEDFFKGKFV